MFQRPLKVLGIEKAIRDGTAERGLVLGSVTRDAFLVFMGVWFCTVNPLVEELFWRGYVHAELGKQLGSSEEEVSSADDDDENDVVLQGTSLKPFSTTTANPTSNHDNLADLNNPL